MSKLFEKLERKTIVIDGLEFELIDGYVAGANPDLAFALKPVERPKPTIIPTVTIKGKEYVALSDVQQLLKGVDTE